MRPTHFRKMSLATAFTLLAAAMGAPRAGAAALTPNQAYVSLVYQDLLGRDPAPAELNTQAGQLDANSITRLQFAGGMTGAAEFLNRQVNDYFQSYLNRPADTPSLSAFVTALQSGATFESVQGSIIASAEYFTLAGSTNASFLDALYGDLLNRPIDDTARTAFLGFLTGGGSRQTVADTVLSSAEYRNTLVGGYFEDFLRRRSSQSDRDPFVSQLGSGGRDQDVISAILASSEYFQLAQTLPEPAGITAGLGLALLVLRRKR